MSFSIDIKSLSGCETKVTLEPGSSTFFVGANGSGKTRLAAHAERRWGGGAHRISAHRALNLNPTVNKVSEQTARSMLRFGGVVRDDRHRENDRWRSNAEIAMLNDFGALVQALFAEQNNIALETHKAARGKTLGEAK